MAACAQTQISSWFVHNQEIKWQFVRNSQQFVVCTLFGGIIKACVQTHSSFGLYFFW
jgi:hypothetical protein